MMMMNVVEIRRERELIGKNLISACGGDEINAPGTADILTAKGLRDLGEEWG